MAGIADMLIGGYNSGRALAKDRQAEANQSNLAGLFSQAYASGKPDLAGIAAVSPEAAVQAQGHFSDLDEAQAKQFAQTAQVFTQAMTPEQRAQAWPGIRAELSKRIPQAQYPEHWDESLLPQAQQLAGVIAQQFGGGSGMPAGYQEFDLLARDAQLSPEDRATAARRALYLERRPSNAAMKYDTIEGSDGRERLFGLDPNAPNATQIGGQQGDPFGFLAQAGAQVTSGYRSKADNERVDGVPNSYHLTGQARDILPPQNQQQADFIRQQAAAQGLEVIDEGDHWHLEPRGQQGPNPFVGRRKEDETFATESAKAQAGLQYAGPMAQAKANETRAVEAAKADVKRDAAAPKRTAKAKFEIDRASRVESAIDRALGQADWNATGLVGSALSAIPGSDAFNLARTVDEIKANIGFREIQTMRDNSPTGGALGQVAIQELQMLQATLGSLDQAQDGEQLRATLSRIKESMARWRQLQEAIASEGGQEAAPASGGWSIRAKGAN